MPDMTSSSAVADGFLLLKLFVLAALILNVVNLGMSIFDRRAKVRRIEPSPLEVRQATEFVTKPEFQTRMDFLAAAMSQMTANLAKLEAARESDGTRLANEMNGIRSDLRTVHGRIDDLPAQIIAMLRNAGALDKRPPS